MINILISLSAVVFLLVAAVKLVRLFVRIRKQQCSQEPRRTPVPTQRKVIRPSPVSFSLSAPSQQRRLIRLLNGDAGAAQRLVEQTRLRHPDRSESWCLEKVIDDLERDRR